MTFEMQEAQDQEVWQWLKIQAHQKAQQASSRKEKQMTGREMLKKIHAQKSSDDYVLWIESKLAELLDRADGLVQEHMIQNQRYTDAGHSNCISSLRQFINGVQLEVDDVTQKIVVDEPPPERQKPVAMFTGKRLKNQRLS
jgi:hypothetical protein